MFTNKIFSNDSIVKKRKNKGFHSGYKVINLDNKQEVIEILFYRSQSKNTGYTTFNCCLWIRNFNFTVKINVGSKSTGCGYDVRADSLINACYDAGINIDRIYDIDTIIDKIIEGLGLSNTIKVKIEG